MTTHQTAATAPDLPTGWRFKIGSVLFALALVPWGLVPPVLFSHLPLATVGTLVAAGVIFQKIVFVSAIAMLGKKGFAALKSKFFRKLAPPAEVGPLRYRIGLVMFCLPLLQGLLETYASHIAPSLVANRLWVDIGADLMLFASVFVLGGNFWDKLRAIFVHQARAVFPDDGEAPAVRPVAA